MTATLANGTNTEMEEYKKVATFMLRFEGRNEMEGSSKHKDEKKFVFLNRPYKFSISVRIVKHKKDCISTGIFTLRQCSRKMIRT